MKSVQMPNFALLLLLGAMLCIALTACGDSDEATPEQEINSVLSAIETAVEERSLSGVMEHIAENYQDHQGNDGKTIARLVQLQTMRNQNINIFTIIRSIEVIDDQASVELSAAMASSGIDLSIESNRLRADAHRFSVSLAKQNSEWKVQSVSWQRGW